MSARPPRRRRFTIRARISLTYSALLGVTGALMLGGVYLFMRFVPTYAVGTAVSPVRDSSAATPAPAPSSTIALTAGPVVRSVDDVFMLLLLISIAAFVVLGAVGAVIGWVIAGRMLRPLQAINAVAQRASDGDLTQRVGASGPHDELRDLSETFDEMLAKLERSFGEHQRFAANASHELRTPIATTRTLLEVALADPEIDAAALRTVAERVYETNRRNEQTVESLLALADAGVVREHEPVRLDELVRDALLAEQDRIRRRAIAVETRLGPVVVNGDRVLLARCTNNLVQNAVRHNLDGGMVRVRVSTEGSRALLEVENDGPPLDDDTIASLTEPFVRGAARVAGAGGHGLGLALVESIARAHGAALALRARDGGGLVVALRLPRRVRGGRGGQASRLQRDHLGTT